VRGVETLIGRNRFYSHNTQK